MDAEFFQLGGSAAGQSFFGPWGQFPEALLDLPAKNFQFALLHASAVLGSDHVMI